jgi:hypothetical protein
MNLSATNMKSDVISDLKDLEYLFNNDVPEYNDAIPNVEIIENQELRLELNKMKSKNSKKLMR